MRLDTCFSSASSSHNSRLMVARSSLRRPRGAVANLLWLITAFRVKSEILLDPVDVQTSESNWYSSSDKRKVTSRILRLAIGIYDLPCIACLWTGSAVATTEHWFNSTAIERCIRVTE